jgi:hypothetical protein
VNWEEEDLIQVTGRKAGRKSPLRIPRYRWVDDIKMDLVEIR